MSCPAFVSTQRPRFLTTRHPRGVYLRFIVPMAAVLVLMPGTTTVAAGSDPLPAAAQALTGVKSYQVTIMTTGNGGFPRRGTGRPSGTPPRQGAAQRRRGLGFGARQETLTAVRRGSTFEDDWLVQGRDASGKQVTTEVVTYNATSCSRSNAKQRFVCQTATANGTTPSQVLSDPTLAFMQGAGATTFTSTANKAINGQVCAGYSYMNKGQTSTASGVVYLSRATNLPCEQIATTTMHFTNAGQARTFSRTQTIIWSKFNDPHLRVPAVPGL